MGLMDTVKGLLKGREKQVKSGIDTASNAVEQKVGPKHADKVDAASDKAKDVVDKLSGTTDRPPAAATPPPTATPAPAPVDTPPAATPPPAAPPA
jgi:hypothetical protein